VLPVIDGGSNGGRVNDVVEIADVLRQRIGDVMAPEGEIGIILDPGEPSWNAAHVIVENG
jgi:hypothetical protein